MYDVAMSDIMPTSLNQNNSVLLATFKKVVKPLVRLFLEKGITYTLLLEELKQVFVEVASEEFKIDGKAQTDSRITLLTGVHRRDVNRFRNSSTKTPQLKTNFSAQLISQWLGNEKFLDELGRPKRLARSNKVNSNDTFDDLVMSVSKDIRSRPVLDEWLRINIVTLDDEGYVHLNSEAFIPHDDLEQNLFFLGMNVHDHLAAAVNNTLNKPKMFERCVYYDNLTIGEITELHEITNKAGMDYLKLLNQKSIEASKTDKPITNISNETKYRMNTGVYFFYEKLKEIRVDE
jgi:hypothetical protein